MNVSSKVRSQLLNACFAFLVPVARFLLRSGISYSEFSEVCRAAFVRVATQEFGIRGRPTNASRVAAMTGIPRKEVSHLRRASGDYDIDERARLSPLSDVLHQWYTDSRYTDDRGAPKPLALEGQDGSFESLVKECVGDVPVGAIRVELARFGAIRVDEFGMVVAVRREIVPDTFDEKLISSISFNLAGLASTIAFNSNPGRTGQGRIERFVQSDAIGGRTRDLLRPIVRARIEAFSCDIDDVFGSYTREKRAESSSRVGVGVYYFEEESR